MKGRSKSADFDKWNLDCNICGAQRTIKDLNLTVIDKSTIAYFYQENIRYCKDNQKCKEKAESKKIVNELSK